MVPLNFLTESIAVITKCYMWLSIVVQLFFYCLDYVTYCYVDLQKFYFVMTPCDKGIFAINIVLDLGQMKLWGFSQISMETTEF